MDWWAELMIKKIKPQLELTKDDPPAGAIYATPVIATVAPFHSCMYPRQDQKKAWRPGPGQPILPLTTSNVFKTPVVLCSCHAPMNANRQGLQMYRDRNISMLIDCCCGLTYMYSISGKDEHVPRYTVLHLRLGRELRLRDTRTHCSRRRHTSCDGLDKVVSVVCSTPLVQENPFSELHVVIRFGLTF